MSIPKVRSEFSCSGAVYLKVPSFAVQVLVDACNDYLDKPISIIFTVFKSFENMILEGLRS